MSLTRNNITLASFQFQVLFISVFVVTLIITTTLYIIIFQEKYVTALYEVLLPDCSLLSALLKNLHL